MKVFTVGLDQKPREEDTISTTTTEKNGPPPSYISMASPMPCQQPAIIVQRKSRGYKGVLLVMLTVFLISVFALTISEIAYNRQRDENFFKLRWAEMKNRMGYTSQMGPYSLFHRNLLASQQQQVNDGPIIPQSSNLIRNNARMFPTTQQQKLTEEPSSPPKMVAVDPAPMEITTQQTTSPSSKSNSNSIEVEQPMSNTLLSGENGSPRDARLDFLRKILQKIRTHAEQMGFDGTMQISVIEVEPQTEQSTDSNNVNSFEKPQQQRFFPMRPPSFFGQPLSGSQQQWGNDNRVGDFGDAPIRPPFLQIEPEGQRPRPFNFLPPPQIEGNQFMPSWPRAEFPRQPPMMHPQSVDSAPPSFPHSGGLWNNNNLYQHQQFMANQRQSPMESERGEVYGRRFGDLLRDLIATRIQNFQNLQAQTTPFMFADNQQQQPQQQQQASDGFQAVQPPRQDQERRPEWRPIGLPVNLQNDFFPPPPEQQGSDDSSKKSAEAPKLPKDFIVSGEIKNENAGNNQPSIAEKQESAEEAQTPKPAEINSMVPSNNDQNRPNGTPRTTDLWSPINIVDKTNDDKADNDKENDNRQPQQQPSMQPVAAPLFFQVDDPNQAQQQTRTAPPSESNVDQ